MKRLFKKAKEAQPKTPRTIPEIQKEFGELSQRAANSQYLVFVHEQELQRVNNRLLEVNQEAAERQQLDAKVKAELASKQQAASPTDAQEKSGAV